MPKLSAGLLMYRFKDEKLEIFLVHPGGPYWAKKDMGSWSIPKGEYSQEEEPFIAAKREFHEETGFELEGQFIPLTTLKQSSGKKITAWAIEGDCDANKIKSNTFKMEWPPRSGKQMEFPEIDRAEWFVINLAKKKILKGQVGFIEELCNILKYEPSEKDKVNNKTEESKAKNKKPVQPSTF